MSEEKKMQAEDNAVVSEPVETSETQKTAPKKGFVDRALPWVIVAIVFFLVGALLTWFLIYQPKVEELATAQADLATAAENATQLQGQIDSLSTELTTVKGNLTTAQATIDSQTTEIARLEQLSVIYKFQADVNAARATLSKLDPASSKQALSFVSADLADLESTNVDPDALSGFKAKIEEANTNLESDPRKALDAMEALYSNLLLLISNLQ